MSKEKTWDTKELQEDFKVHYFIAGTIVVTQLSDGVKGVMDFDHRPRKYYNFRPLGE